MAATASAGSRLGSPVRSLHGAPAGRQTSRTGLLSRLPRGRVGVAFATALTWVVRTATGHATYTHYLSRDAILTVSLIALRSSSWSGWGLRLLVLLGVRAPTRLESHANHGAYSWKDYFKVNTDHKVIGVQYVVTSFFFLLVGGMIAMLMRIQLAQPGSKFVDANTYNGLFSVHATVLIFFFVIPVFAGLANFVLPLMIGAPDMAFPRLNALSFWMLPLGGAIMLLSFLAPGGAFADGWTAYAPLSTVSRSARTSSRSGCSARAPPRSPLRSISL